MKLFFLIGPTAVGKTALAIEWAQAHDAEILCADAPLVYKGMDIGTAKPTAEERRAVPHHGIDYVTMTERFSVADYIERARQVVADVQLRDKVLLVAGGSAFYLKSFFENVTDGVGVGEEVVNEVANLFKNEGLAGLLKELRRRGGKDLTGLDTRNPRRVIKALERVRATGKSFRELHEEFRNQPRPYANFQKRVVMLMRENEDLKARIRLRAEIMLNGGLLEEVRRLEASGLSQNPQAASVIDYREVLAFLRGEISSREALLELIVQDTLALARKQRTFFKQLPVSKTLFVGPDHKPDAQTLFD